MDFWLDKTSFKKQTAEEAEQTREYWLSLTPVERLSAAYYLISVAYNFDIKNPPRMD